MGGAAAYPPTSKNRDIFLMPLAISVSIFNKKKSAFEENCTQIIEGIVQAYFFENTVIYTRGQNVTHPISKALQ